MLCFGKSIKNTLPKLEAAHKTTSMERILQWATELIVRGLWLGRGRTVHPSFAISWNPCCQAGAGWYVMPWGSRSRVHLGWQPVSLQFSVCVHLALAARYHMVGNFKACQQYQLHHSKSSWSVQVCSHLRYCHHNFFFGVYKFWYFLILQQNI